MRTFKTKQKPTLTKYAVTVEVKIDVTYRVIARSSDEAGDIALEHVKNMDITKEDITDVLSTECSTVDVDPEE